MLAILLIAALAALWFKGSGKIDNRQGIVAGLGILGALLAFKSPGVGLAMMGVAAAIGMMKPSRRRTVPVPTPADVTEASALLGVAPDADDDEVRAAHRRLIALAHPDKGGTPALASRINAARDILLQRNTGAVRR